MALTTARRKPARARWRRFLNSGVMLARLFLGYKAISLLQRFRGEAWAEERRHRHHRHAATLIYETAVHDQGMLIKTAQFLSSRPDIVPDEYVSVLSALQDEVPPIPFEAVRGVVERELGRPLEDVFVEFARQPVAAASLAQVHRAVLKDGRVAAVKVQYPGIQDLVRADLRNLSAFIKVLNRLDKTVDYTFIAEEMANMIPRELDFLQEGRNAERIAANFADAEDIVIPAIFWEYTTRRVLTMEYVEGVKITDTAGIRALGIDPTDVGKVLIVAFSEMLLQHGLFHADPHPGNLMVAPGRPTDDGRSPKLVLVDFGQVKEIGPQFRFVFGQMTRALLAEDDSALGRTFRDLGFRMKSDAEEGYVDLGNAYVGNITKEMMSQTERGWVTPDMFQQSYSEVLRILRANPLLKIPPDLLFVGRVMGLLNGLSMSLRSRTNLLIEMARLLDEADARRRDGTAAPSGPRRLLEA